MKLYHEINTRIDGITEFKLIDSSKCIIISKPDNKIIKINNSTDNYLTHYNIQLQEYNFEDSNIIKFTMNNIKLYDISYKNIIGKIYIQINDFKIFKKIQYLNLKINNITIMLVFMVLVSMLK